VYDILNSNVFVRAKVYLC